MLSYQKEPNYDWTSSFRNKTGEQNK